MRLVIIDTLEGSASGADYVALKNSGVHGVIFHAGYGSDVSQKDSGIDEAYRKAKEAGLLCGAYWFMYARSREDAIAEADACSQALAGKKCELGVYYDYEEDTLAYMDRCSGSKDDMTGRIIAFLERMQENGWQNIGWYANPSCIAGKNGATALNMNRLAPYPLWIAKYNGNEQTEDPGTDYNGVHIIGHQFANMDCNPEWIKGCQNFDTSVFEIDKIEIDNDTPEQNFIPSESRPVVDMLVNIGGAEQWLSSLCDPFDMDNESTGYCGKKGRTIEAVCIRADGINIGYAVHLKEENRWLPFVEAINANIEDGNNGYAGKIGQEIDAVCIATDSDTYAVEYQVQTIGGTRYAPVNSVNASTEDSNNGYAGSFGSAIERITARIIER